MPPVTIDYSLHGASFFLKHSMMLDFDRRFSFIYNYDIDETQQKGIHSLSREML